MRKILISWVAAILLFVSASSQSITPSVINAAGNTFKVPSENFYLDWSIAEMTLVNTMSHLTSHNRLYVITNGYLQPDKKEEGNSKDNEELYTKGNSGFTASEVRVFPNPAINHVEVHFFMTGTGKATLILFNSMGQQVFSKEVTLYNKGSIERIPVQNYAPGTYMLYIRLNDNKNIINKQGSYKIIKM